MRKLRLEKPMYNEDANWLAFYGESGGNLCGQTCGLEW